MNNKLASNKSIYKFQLKEIVKTVVGKRNKQYYHTQRKGSIGTILNRGISLNKPMYWIKFKNNYEEWYYEDEIIIW